MRKRRPARQRTFARSECPVVVTLDTVGDKWSLVIVRDLAMGKRRFSEFLQSPEGIKRNILTERLNRLEAAGILGRLQYQERPVRFEYHLTAKGAHLLPILQAIARWAADYVPGVLRPPAEFLAQRPADLYPSRSRLPESKT